jgi:hypothetical protein
VTPDAIKDCTLTSLRQKLIKIGANIVNHGRYVTFQMAEVAIPRDMFAELLQQVAALCSPLWCQHQTRDTLRSSYRGLTTGELRPNEQTAGFLGLRLREFRRGNHEPEAQRRANPAGRR